VVIGRRQPPAPVVMGCASPPVALWVGYASLLSTKRPLEPTRRDSGSIAAPVVATAVRRFAAERPASNSRRDAVAREFLPLADALARRFQRRFADMIKLDDARKVARLELIRAVSIRKAFTPRGIKASMQSASTKGRCWTPSPAR